DGTPARLGSHRRLEQTLLHPGGMTPTPDPLRALRSPCPEGARFLASAARFRFTPLAGSARVVPREKETTMTTTDLTADSRHGESATSLARVLEASRIHSELAALALARHGDHGPQISGCVRDHFPEDTKAVLRIHARQVTELCELAHAARPP